MVTQETLVELLDTMVEKLEHKEYNINGWCPGKLEKVPGVELDNDTMDTNGWQWDYWVEFTYRNTVFMLSGSGYYGTASINLKEE